MMASYLDSITGMELDILKEIGNIGAGNAATSLSKLLGKKVDIKVPSVRVISFDEMMDLAGGSDNVVAGVFLRIEGDAPGSMFFQLPLSQASRFIGHLTGNPEFSFENPGEDDLPYSALQELANILSGSYLSALADFTKLALLPSVPALGIDMAGALISYGLIEASQSGDYAIVIDTSLSEDDFENNEEVKGHFFLFPDPESFKILFNALEVPKE